MSAIYSQAYIDAIGRGDEHMAQVYRRIDNYGVESVEQMVRNATGTLPLTLDYCLEAFERNPTIETACALRMVAHEYCNDEMIGDQELFDIIASTDAWAEKAGVTIPG